MNLREWQEYVESQFLDDEPAGGPEEQLPGRSAQTKSPWPAGKLQPPLEALSNQTFPGSSHSVVFHRSTLESDAGCADQVDAHKACPDATPAAV
ncbi:MAG TPA: hypothetical protein VGS41_05230, partial [Chthonomonadales bacterium]|nr:hypothetical protein [Chthonomonadales bacterium]